MCLLSKVDSVFTEAVVRHVCCQNFANYRAELFVCPSAVTYFYSGL